MAVPPLHHGILYAGIYGIGFQKTDRHFQAVENMQDGDGDYIGAEKPVGHVYMFYPALRNRAKKNIGIDNPNDGN